MTINEIRELENLNPIGPEGDTHFVPMNMTTLEKAVAEPPAPVPEQPAPAPEPPPADEPEDTPEEEEETDGT
jgi:hypothetical protein